MKSKTRKLFDNKQFVQVFSLVLAVLLWLLVATTDPGSAKTDQLIKDVPVNLDMQAAVLAKQGLNVFDDGNQIYVDVLVTGERSVVGALKPSDLSVTVNTRSVDGPRPYYDLPLEYAGMKGAEPFEVKTISPRSIPVRIDRLATKNFVVQPRVNGLGSAPLGRDYVQGTEYVNPDILTVTGPQASVDRIREVVAVEELTGPLEKNHVSTLDVVLLDAKGEEIDPEAELLILSSSQVQLHIPIYKSTGLELTLQYLNIPKGFPIEQLEGLMTMTPDHIVLAGPPDQIDKITQRELGVIDLKTLRPGENEFTFDVELPSPAEQYVRVDNVTQATVVFDDSRWATTRFHVPIRERQILGRPAGYSAKLLSTKLYNVEFVGDKDALAKMTADDIMVEIDLSERELQEGSREWPVKISAPTSGLVWPVGSYTTVVSIEKQ